MPLRRARTANTTSSTRTSLKSTRSQNDTQSNIRRYHALSAYMKGRCSQCGAFAWSAACISSRTRTERAPTRRFGEISSERLCRIFLAASLCPICMRRPARYVSYCWGESRACRPRRPRRAVPCQRPMSEPHDACAMWELCDFAMKSAKSKSLRNVLWRC